jgi:hypothetical protein
MTANKSIVPSCAPEMMQRPGVRIEFSQKPADFDEFMNRYRAFIKCGKNVWVWSSDLGTTTVKAIEHSDGQFVIVIRSDTRLHIPWERANRLGKNMISHYREIILSFKFE